jgi:hypothetical protein
VIRTNFLTLSATLALVTIKHHLRLEALTFGVVAPRTFQITALKKHGCTNAGAVYKGISFNIKNSSSKHIFSPVNRLKYIFSTLLEKSLQNPK